ncbi:hypothetical protein GCM10028895_10570 [Pontibacter rugosus]
MVRLAETVTGTGCGFNAFAIDQRGYNLSDKPQNVINYTTDVLVADVLRVANHFGISSFHLLGHDFGALISWQLALHHPERLKRMIIVNVPHPFVLNKFLLSRPTQMLKSAYMAFFSCLTCLRLYLN